MDWNLAVERNTTALRRIVAMLVAMTGLGAPFTSPLRGGRREASGGGCALSGTSTPNPSPQGGGGQDRLPLPRHLHRAVLRPLRPAESAVRRLIVVAARGLVVPPSPPRSPRPRPKTSFTRNGKGTGIVPLPGVRLHPAPRSISLPLFDPLTHPFSRRRPTSSGVPRISTPGVTRLFPVKHRRPPSPGDPLDATRLAMRIHALTAALDDLPRQARRLARWRANRDAAKAREKIALQTGAKIRFHRISPLRPGRPPGAIRRPNHEIHALLTDLHGLAYDVLRYPDTS